MTSGEIPPGVSTKGVVLVAHGGQASSTAPTSALQPAVLRMIPVAAAIRQGLRGSGAVVRRPRFRVRGWNGAYLKPGESRSVAFLPSLLRARLEHRKLAWGKAQVARAAEVTSVAVPAGRFKVYAWTVEVEGGGKLTYEVEAEPPYRLVRFTGGGGEEGVLLGSKRLAYWMMNEPGGENALPDLGLPVP